MIKQVKHCDLYSIEPENINWLEWLEEEVSNVRLRFGSDTEALEFWPNDYYEKMESWWRKGENLEAISVYYDEKQIIRILDGWHRVAICHKIGMLMVPVLFFDSDGRPSSI